MCFLCFYPVIGVFDLGPVLRMEHVEAPITPPAVPGTSVAARLGSLQTGNTWQCCTRIWCLEVEYKSRTASLMADSLQKFLPLNFTQLFVYAYVTDCGAILYVRSLKWSQLKENSSVLFSIYILLIIQLMLLIYRCLYV